MTTQGNPYRNTNEEYREICAFLNNLSTLDPHMLWESGRMSIWRHTLHAAKPQDDSFFRDNARVWRTETNEVVGLCISEYGRDDLFIEVHPDWHSIYPDILDWVESVWSATRGEVHVHLFADDEAKISHLKARGFAFAAHTENKRTYDLGSISLDYLLEAGFEIQTLAEFGDLEARVALVQSAFDNPSYTIDRVQGMVASPEYRGEYDLMAIAPDGQPAAYCVGWHEGAREGNGFIEPVGTHADFRRRGFATAVIKECFARLKKDGIHTVEIASGAEPNPSNFLYESLSPATKREVHSYGKAGGQG